MVIEPGEWQNGKVITASLPVSWFTEEKWDFEHRTEHSPYGIYDEVYVPWDVGPEYFTTIEIVSKYNWATDMWTLKAFP